MVIYVNGDTIISHHGVLGMKWGIRRYQNKDGTLTSEGRRRLGLDKYSDQDYVIKRGQKATRVSKVTLSGDDYRELTKEELKKAEENFRQREDSLDTKYLNTDEGSNRDGKYNGTEFYFEWFGEEGLGYDNLRIDTYELNRDIKVASGKKVVDEIIKEYGNTKMTDLLKQKDAWEARASSRKMAMEYTTNKDMFNAINKRLKDQGYDAVDDINDPSTNRPIILLDSKRSLNRIKTENGVDYSLKLLNDKKKEVKDEETIAMIDREIADIKKFYGRGK